MRIPLKSSINEGVGSLWTAASKSAFFKDKAQHIYMVILLRFLGTKALKGLRLDP